MRRTPPARWNANCPDASVFVLVQQFHTHGAVARVCVELCEQLGGPAFEWLSRFVCAHGATLGRGDDQGNVECLINFLMGPDPCRQLIAILWEW